MLPATITKIQQAFKEIKHMQCDTWKAITRPAARDALKDILEHRMGNAVDAHLEQKRVEGFPDRRNGSYPRHLLTELGDLGLRIPRTRTFSARVLLKRFARRAFCVEHLILLSFLFGLSTRKVARLCSPSWVNRQPCHREPDGKQLDQAVQAYQQRPLSDTYEVLFARWHRHETQNGHGRPRTLGLSRFRDHLRWQKRNHRLSASLW